jgi:hypothetical protein
LRMLYVLAGGILEQSLNEGRVSVLPEHPRNKLTYYNPQVISFFIQSICRGEERCPKSQENESILVPF